MEAQGGLSEPTDARSGAWVSLVSNLGLSTPPAKPPPLGRHRGSKRAAGEGTTTTASKVKMGRMHTQKPPEAGTCRLDREKPGAGGRRWAGDRAGDSSARVGSGDARPAGAGRIRQSRTLASPQPPGQCPLGGSGETADRRDAAATRRGTRGAPAPVIARSCERRRRGPASGERPRGRLRSTTS